MHNREKRPLVVMAHGGPHASVDPSLTLMRYVLLKAGYVLLMPNFSGSVGFGSHHLQAALGSIGQVDAQ
jgi:acylaminoacyl-peptidase